MIALHPQLLGQGGRRELLEGLSLQLEVLGGCNYGGSTLGRSCKVLELRDERMEGGDVAFKWG